MSLKSKFFPFYWWIHDLQTVHLRKANQKSFLTNGVLRYVVKYCQWIIKNLLNLLATISSWNKTKIINNLYGIGMWWIYFRASTHDNMCGSSLCISNSDREKNYGDHYSWFEKSSFMASMHANFVSNFIKFSFVLIFGESNKLIFLSEMTQFFEWFWVHIEVLSKNHNRALNQTMPIFATYYLLYLNDMNHIQCVVFYVHLYTRI